MVEKILKQIDYIAGLLPIAALFGLAAFVTNIEIKDLDLWLHLGMGKFISETHRIPTVDILSCTFAGKPWINHEWLFQVIVYNIYQSFGVNGLLKMQGALVILTMFMLLIIGYSKDRQLFLAFILTLVYLVFQQRFTIRPDLFSLFFFTIYIFVLSIHIDKRWAVFVLFIVQVLWSNIHGFFFFGPLFVLIGIVSEWIKRLIPLPYEWNESGRLTDEEFRRLHYLFLIVALASFINPQTVQGALYPIAVFFSLSGENKIFFEYIQELQKPVSINTLFDSGQFVYYKLLIVISALTFMYNRRRIDVSALLLWILFLIFSLKAARNTTFFAFAAYLVIITNMWHINIFDVVPIRYVEKKFEYITTALLKILFLLWIMNFCYGIAQQGYYDFAKYEHKSEFGGVSQREYPQRAVAFLIDNKVKGNFFNDFNAGAYLVGHVFPDIKVFIDGRTEVYGGEFFRQYQEIWSGGRIDIFEKAVEQYGITGAFLSSVKQKIPGKLVNYLYTSKDWALVYFDYDAVIFLKHGGENEALINKFKIDLSQWQPEVVDLYKMGAAKTIAYHNNYRAYTLESLGFDDLAMQEAKEAIRISPHYSDPYQIMGKIHAKKRDYQMAFEMFRVASIFAPQHKETRYNLALSYYDLNQFDLALNQYKEIAQIWPYDPKAVFSVAKVYAKEKKYDEAMNSLKEALRMAPKAKADVAAIGDVAFDNNDFEQAKGFYELADAHGERDAGNYLRIAKCEMELRQWSKAKENLDKAQALDQANEEVKKVYEQLNTLSAQ